MDPSALFCLNNFHFSEPHTQPRKQKGIYKSPAHFLSLPRTIDLDPLGRVADVGADHLGDAGVGTPVVVPLVDPDAALALALEVEVAAHVDVVEAELRHAGGPWVAAAARPAVDHVDAEGAVPVAEAVVAVRVAPVAAALGEDEEVIGGGDRGAEGGGEEGGGLETHFGFFFDAEEGWLVSVMMEVCHWC